MRPLYMPILALGLLACEESVLGDGTVLPPPKVPVPEQGIDIATFHSAKHARLCALLEQCCTPTEGLFVTSCEEALIGHEAQARFRADLVDAGRARWDGLAAEACVAAFDSTTCDDLVRADYGVPSCPDALVYLEPRAANPCANYPCGPGAWCQADEETYVCSPDLAEGEVCTEEQAACGNLQRCRRPVRTNDRFCEPSLCDGDTANDPRTVLTEFYRGQSGAGGSRTVQCALPPDGFFECSCVDDGVASSCKSDQLFQMQVDFENYICC